MRLQQEANQKIAELAERAHTEAISYVYIYIRWFMYQQYLEMYMHECIMKISKNLSLLNAHVWYMIHNLAI